MFVVLLDVAQPNIGVKGTDPIDENVITVDRRKDRKMNLLAWLSRGLVLL